MCSWNAPKVSASIWAGFPGIGSGIGLGIGSGIPLESALGSSWDQLQDPLGISSGISSGISPGIGLGIGSGIPLGSAPGSPWNQPWNPPGISQTHQTPNQSQSQAHPTFPMDIPDGYSRWNAAPGPSSSMEIVRNGPTQIPAGIPALLEPESLQGNPDPATRTLLPYPPFPNSQYSIIPPKIPLFLRKTFPFSTSRIDLILAQQFPPRTGNSLGNRQVWGGSVQFPLKFPLKFPVFRSPLTISARRCRAAALCIQRKLPWIPG